MKFHNEKTLLFYTEHRQFYITDKEIKLRTNSGSFWTEQAYQDKLAVEDGQIGVLASKDGEVKIQIQLLKDPKNEINQNYFEHIVEGSIDLRSGFLQILDCPGTNVQMESKLTPGFYRIRVYTIKSNSTGKTNYYKIELWRDIELRRRKVLKS